MYGGTYSKFKVQLSAQHSSPQNKETTMAPARVARCAAAALLCVSAWFCLSAFMPTGRDVAIGSNVNVPRARQPKLKRDASMGTGNAADAAAHLLWQLQEGANAKIPAPCAPFTPCDLASMRNDGAAAHVVSVGVLKLPRPAHAVDNEASLVWPPSNNKQHADVGRARQYDAVHVAKPVQAAMRTARRPPVLVSAGDAGSVTAGDGMHAGDMPGEREYASIKRGGIVRDFLILPPGVPNGRDARRRADIMEMDGADHGRDYQPVSLDLRLPEQLQKQSRYPTSKALFKQFGFNLRASNDLGLATEDRDLRPTVCRK